MESILKDEQQGSSMTPLGKYQCPGAEIEAVKQEKEDDGEKEEDEELKLVRVSTLSEAWVRLESHRDVSHCLPAKDEDEDDVGLDPERVVLFDDIATVSVHFTRHKDCSIRYLLSFLGSLVLPCVSFKALICLSLFISSNSHRLTQEILHPVFVASLTDG